MKREKNLSRLQEIEDYYINLGYKGEKLRKTLMRDKEYQKLLKERKQKLTKKIKISHTEKKKYILSTDFDFEILEKCKKLEKLKLNKNDESLIKLIKIQLEDDWRAPLINQLNELIQKYKK